jgi:hypothetical protein
MCSGRMSSSCSTRDTRRVDLVTNPLISHERGKDREVFTTNGTYPWSCVTQIFHNGQSIHCGDRKSFEVMTSTYLRGIIGSVAYLLAVTLYQCNPDRNQKLWNIVSNIYDLTLWLQRFVYNRNFVCGISPVVMVISAEWRHLFHDVILTSF